MQTGEGVDANPPLRSLCVFPSTPLLGFSLFFPRRTETLRAEKSLRTLPEKKVLKFSRNALQKSTPLVSNRRGSKFTIRIWLRSVASRKTRISIRHAGINVRNYALQSKDSHYPLFFRKTLSWSLLSHNAILHS